MRMNALALLVLGGLATTWISACGDPAPLASAPPAPIVSPSPRPIVPAAIYSGPTITMVTNPRVKDTDFQAGIGLLVYLNDPSYKKEVGPLLNELASDNINSLAIGIPLYQSCWSCNDIHADPLRTPSKAELAYIVEQAQLRGFTVMLRPILDEASITPLWYNWRGDIHPTNVNTWFANYDAVMLDYAAFAQSEQIDILDLGTELDSMERYTAAWNSLIARVRAGYGGELTYSSNWEDHLPSTIGRHLDFISVDAWYPLSQAINATIPQLEAGWHGPLGDMKAQSRASGVPVVATELGMIPFPGVNYRPWAPTSPGYAYEPQVQHNYYQAACSALSRSMPGMYWWDINLRQPPPPSSAFDPLSVPGTEAIIKACYGALPRNFVPTAHSRWLAHHYAQE